MNPIIVAIDTTDLARAKHLCWSLSGHVGAVKLGLEFFTAHGASGVREVVPEGMPLFLDLKFHDIPNTVSKAIKALQGLPISLLTIHTSGGASMMQAARDAANELIDHHGKRPMVLGVTVLTSLGENDMEQIGATSNVAKQVEKLALLAKKSGLDGVVCSPHEIILLRKTIGSKLKLIVPGIRPEGSAAGDQKRTMTPKEALNAGADYLVIGRPITEAADPLAAVQAIHSSL